MNRSAGKLFRTWRQVVAGFHPGNRLTIDCTCRIDLGAGFAKPAPVSRRRSDHIDAINAPRWRHPRTSAAKLRQSRRANQLRVNDVTVPAPLFCVRKSTARKNCFREPIQSDLNVQHFRQKYFALSENRFVPISRHPVLTRGADASSRTWSRDAMDAAASPDECRCSGRQRRVVLISRRWDQVSQDDELRGDGG